MSDASVRAALNIPSDYRTESERIHDLETAVTALIPIVEWTLIRFGKASDTKDIKPKLNTLDVIRAALE